MKRKTGRLLVVVGTCVYLLGCDAGQPQLKQSQTESQRIAQPKKEDAITKSEIWVAAKDFVRNQLKSPPSASFGSVWGAEYQDSDQAVTKLTEHAWAASGWVDATNSFGASIRTKFYLELQKSGSSLDVTYFEFDGQEPYGQSILPNLTEIREKENRIASEKRLEGLVVEQESLGNREFLKVKLKNNNQSTRSDLLQIGEDLRLKAKRTKLFAWVYNHMDEFLGCLVVSKQDVVLSDESHIYQDPFRPEGYFGFREWSSPNGRFKLTAKFAGSGNGKVLIVDEEDRRRDIELTKLSETDQEWVKRAPDLLPK